MNKQFELFLIKACELVSINEEGTMLFSTHPHRYFDCARYAEGLPRDEDSELILWIHIDKTNKIRLEIEACGDITFGTTELSFVNATLENISRWVKAVDTNASEQVSEQQEQAA